MNNDKSLAQVADIFQTHIAFSQCKQEELARLLSKISIKTFKKNDTLLNADQKAKSLFFVLEGCM